MALNPEILAAQIVIQIEADTKNQLPDISRVVWGAVAKAIISHIQTAGEVAVTVSAVSGVAPGAGLSGPGTGTGIIT